MTTKKHLFTGQNQFFISMHTSSYEFRCYPYGLRSQKKKEEQNEAKLGEVSNVQSKMP